MSCSKNVQINSLLRKKTILYLGSLRVCTTVSARRHYENTRSPSIEREPQFTASYFVIYIFS